MRNPAVGEPAVPVAEDAVFGDVCLDGIFLAGCDAPTSCIEVERIFEDGDHQDQTGTVGEPFQPGNTEGKIGDGFGFAAGEWHHVELGQLSDVPKKRQVGAVRVDDRTRAGMAASGEGFDPTSLDPMQSGGALVRIKIVGSDGYHDETTVGSRRRLANPGDLPQVFRSDGVSHPARIVRGVGPIPR